jgi:hypothetical protein
MNMSNIVARLSMAGDRNVQMRIEACKAIDQFAEWLQSIFPEAKDGQISLLPRGYTFTYRVSGTYRIEKMYGSQLVVSLGKHDKSIREISVFYMDVNSGFVKELSEMLEAGSDIMDSATKILKERMLTPLSSSLARSA